MKTNRGSKLGIHRVKTLWDMKNPTMFDGKFHDDSTGLDWAMMGILRLSVQLWPWLPVITGYFYGINNILFLWGYVSTYN